MRAWLGTWYSRIVSRLVTGVESRLPRDGRRTLHLSFDDGPTERTPELLDLLDEFEIPATFYLLGEQAREHPEAVAEIASRGHAIGNHSMTHVDAWKANDETIDREFDEAESLLADLSGGPIETMRPPFGRINKGVVRWARSRGRRIVLWDAMPPDFDERATPERVSSALRGRVRRGSIVVLHDNEKSRGRTIPALRETLPILLDEGWEFVALPGATVPKSTTLQAGERAA